MTIEEFKNKHNVPSFFQIWYLEYEVREGGRRIEQPELDPYNEENWGFENGPYIDQNQLTIKNYNIDCRSVRSIQKVNEIRNTEQFYKYLQPEEFIKDLSSVKAIYT